MWLRQGRLDSVLLYFDLKYEKHCSGKDLEGSLVTPSPVRQHFPRPNRANRDTPGQKQNHKNSPEASRRAPVRGAAAGRAPSARYGARGHLRQLRPRDSGRSRGRSSGLCPGSRSPAGHRARPRAPHIGRAPPQPPLSRSRSGTPGAVPEGATPRGGSPRPRSLTSR